MKLPAKVEYAYKAVLELAIRHDGDKPIQLSTICESQGIPKKFLIQLLLRLKNANIVGTSRGTAGGYYLTRPPSRISLAEVIKAIDDSIIEAPREVRRGKASESDRLIGKIWADIAKDTAKRLEEITFDKMVLKINNQQIVYNI